MTGGGSGSSDERDSAIGAARGVAIPGAVAALPVVGGDGSFSDDGGEVVGEEDRNAGRRGRRGVVGAIIGGTVGTVRRWERGRR